MPRESWRIALVVAVQALILALVPMKQVLARRGGETVTLRTAPVDPYDPFSGHHAVLSYEVERAASEGALRIGKGGGDRARAGRVWIVVERAEPAWRFVAVSEAEPAPASGRAALLAERDGRGWVRIEGAGRFYLPEARQAEALEAMRGGSGLVDLKVLPGGEVAVTRLRVGDLVLED